MCLAVPGKVLDIEVRDGTRWPRSTSAGSRRRCAWSTCPTPRSATTRSSTWASPSAARRGVGAGDARAVRRWACWKRSSATPGGARPRRPGCPARTARTTPSRRRAMKYLDEFQDPELARRLLDDIHAHRDPALGDDGGLRRPDALDHPARPRPAPARRDRADPRARLPGLRDAAGGHRQGAGDRLPSRRDLLLLRRHAAGARQRHATCSG